jgi:hypothetical protein
VAGLTAEGGDGLRVAVRSAEAPPALLAEADLGRVSEVGRCGEMLCEWDEVT